MKPVFIILFFYPLSFYSQPGQQNYYYIDREVVSIPFNRADSLAKQLAGLGKSDREKVRAIFRWITTHIDYNVKIFNRNKNTPGLFYEEPEDSAAALPSLNARVAAKVLYKKIAFCDGYSRLFKTLCDHAGIRSEIISGYARTNINRNVKFGVNHIWNAVYLDSAWHLLDVTWASGYVSYGNEFIRQYNDFYFLTPPEQFILDHYPEDLQWTLLNSPPVYREFNQGPFRYSAYVKSGISAYFPAKGIIDISDRDSIKIELRTIREVKSFFVSEHPFIDSTQSLLSQVYPGEKLRFIYKNTSTASEWLYVFCNEELVLRYKLNTRKESAANSRLTAPL